MSQVKAQRQREKSEIARGSLWKGQCLQEARGEEKLGVFKLSKAESSSNGWDQLGASSRRQSFSDALDTGLPGLAN